MICLSVCVHACSCRRRRVALGTRADPYEHQEHHLNASDGERHVRTEIYLPEHMSGLVAARDTSHAEILIIEWCHAWL